MSNTRTYQKISILIPAYNEQENLPILLGELNTCLSSLGNHEIIIVDDGSEDKTQELLKSLVNDYPCLRYVFFSKNFGHQAALKAAYDRAYGDVVITLDADLQHPVSLIPQMLEQWKKGYDVVYTQRVNDQNLSFFKKLSSSFFYRLIRFLSGVSIEQGTADFRLLDQKVVNLIKKSQDPYLFIRGYIPWMGFNQCKLTYQASPRLYGDTKYSLSKMTSFALKGITGFSIKPLRLATVLGLLFSFFAFLYALYALAVYFMDDRVISGWASVLISILLMGGIQLIILGIMGEYIGKMYMQLKQRPMYIVEEEGGQDAR